MRALLFLFFAPILAGPPVNEFIYARAPYPSCHASTIVELKQGGIMAAWFGGKDEGEPDVAIWGAVKPAPNQPWTTPVELAREKDVATYNPVLFYTADGRFWLYYKFGPSPERWSAARKVSTDHGKTWSATEYLPAGILGPIRSKPHLLADGTIVSGTSFESYRTWSTWMERSKDHGKTWTKIGPILPPSWDRTRGLIQPSVVALPGGRLRFYARATPELGKIYAGDSTDGGLTWTEAKPLDLPNPNSGVDAVTLKDGRVVLIYNHTAKGRSPLNLGVSRDGTRFHMFRTLETDPGEFSYPAIVQGADGDLHMTYTWNRKKIRYVRVPLTEVPSK